MTKHCNTQSFPTFVRLYSYSTHFCAFTMPIYTFFEYSFIYEYRPLNRLEIKLFRTLRTEVFNQNPIIINMDSLFLFFISCGSVLSSLLINDVDIISQDLNFFWIGDSWVKFCSQIDRFRRRSQANIIAEMNLNSKELCEPPATMISCSKYLPNFKLR
ncbi:unnamed protein product [Rotaria socialis]|uniref:Uncharacterized protein n=1 Tax=Rotaria socialis TaxID=392032 RepID=A0A820YLQ9_9BILA|nr:unnamed protein product [Rotaria socialis]CAF4551023.1 unnamed protein product [Rotaria socialis]